ncbi:hypothetical protein L083_5112 [Actinoplanes sp. N902-109]|nr:hypothetical protein L083_5112 [Actinoplanes sp. N902-109]
MAGDRRSRAFVLSWTIAVRGRSFRRGRSSFVGARPARAFAFTRRPAASRRAPRRSCASGAVDVVAAAP